jgi:hypothetical protein
MGAIDIHYYSAIELRLSCQVDPVPQHTTVRPADFQQVYFPRKFRKHKAVFRVRASLRHEPFSIAREQLDWKLFYVVGCVVSEINSCRQIRARFRDDCRSTQRYSEQ